MQKNSRKTRQISVSLLPAFIRASQSVSGGDDSTCGGGGGVCSDDGDDGVCSSDDDGGGGSSDDGGGCSIYEQTHYLQQADPLQKALLMLRWLCSKLLLYFFSNTSA